MTSSSTLPAPRVRMPRRALGAAALLGASTARRTAFAQVSGSSNTSPTASPRLRPFGPRAAPYDEAGRRALAADTLLYLWELHGLRAGRPVFSLPSTPVLGTTWEVGESRWQFSIPAGFPIYLIAYASVNRLKYDLSLTKITVDGMPLTNLSDYFYTALRAPVGTNIHDHDVADLVFAPPAPGTYVITIKRPEFETEYHLTVNEPIGLGPLVLRDLEGVHHVLHGEKRRALPDQETALALGFRPQAIVPASSEVMAELPEGSPVPRLREGMIVRAEREHLFRLTDGRRAWIVSPQELEQAVHADTSGAQGAVHVLDNALLYGMPPELRHNSLFMSTGGDVYHVDSGDLRYVKEWSWITERGLRLDDTWRIPEHLFRLLPFNRSHGQAAGVTRRDVVFHSEAVGNELPYRVFLPHGYGSAEARQRRYPVIYLLHGRGAHYDEWTDYAVERWLDEIYASEPDDRSRKSAIVVLPQGSTGWWSNQNNGPRWGDSVAKDLVTHVDATYRTLPTRDGRGIGGLSMGGFGALHLALTFPDIFGVVGARGPALYERNQAPGFWGGTGQYHHYDPITLVRESKIERPLRVWLDVASSDHWKPRVELLREAVRGRGWPLEWNEFPGVHTRDYWGSNVKEFLAFFFHSFSATGGTSRLV